MRIGPEQLFPIVLGVADGTCTSLVLASQKMLAGTFDLWQALRIGILSSAAGFLPLWVAEYASLRNELARMARQLNQPSVRPLLRSDLGLSALHSAWFTAGLATLSSFLGACLPLGAAVLYPRQIYLPLLMANLVLMLMGIGLGRWVEGRRWVWALGLMAIGNALALLGLKVGIS